MNVQINQACQKFEELKTRGGSYTNALDQLKMSVKKLKSHIPSKLKIHYDNDSKPHRKPWFDGSINSSIDNYQVDVNKAGNLQSLYNQPKFDHTTALEDIQVSFHSLPPKLKFCLNFFPIFPEMAIIKKRFMIYWWIGEGLIHPIKSMGQNTEEEIVLGKTQRILSTRSWMSFLQRASSSLSTKIVDWLSIATRCPPYILSALIFEPKSCGFFRHGCLTFWNRCIVNVGATIIDGRHEIFSKGTNLKVVYLGRWQNSVTHDIEVPYIKILNALKNMKQLRFLSLRGISLIVELPRFISQLTNLKILDLKACHNLEVLPDWIGLLKSLTHLDISECYFLDHISKSLGSLAELQVLKGFIIGDSKDKSSCTIDDLTKLPKLRKLSIYTSMKEFPTNKQLRHLQRLKTLQKLKISWSSCILQGEIDDIPKQAHLQPRLRAQLTKALTRSVAEQHDSELPLQLELPCSLQKLELECFPEMITPSWLWSNNMKNLKKLYIKGGLLCSLGAIVVTTVEMLQLKYLNQLQMHWLDLRILFPNLIYLEKVECPDLISFPCDGNGVWMNRENMQNQEMGS